MRIFPYFTLNLSPWQQLPCEGFHFQGSEMEDYKADENAHQLDFQNTSLFFSRQFGKRFIT